MSMYSSLLYHDLGFTRQASRYRADVTFKHLVNGSGLSDSVFNQLNIRTDGVVVIDSDGDLYLEVGRTERTTLRVSRACLQEKSRYFKAFLAPRWSPPDAYNNPGAPLVLHGDDTTAMVRLMRALHYNYWHFTNSPIADLRGLLIVGDKYLCDLRLRAPPGMKSWASTKMTEAFHRNEAFEDALVVSFYMGLEAQFTLASRAILFTRTPEQMRANFAESANFETVFKDDPADIFLTEYSILHRWFTNTLSTLCDSPRPFYPPIGPVPAQSSLLQIVGHYTRYVDPESKIPLRYVGNNYFSFQDWLLRAMPLHTAAIGPGTGWALRVPSLSQHPSVLCDVDRYYEKVRTLDSYVDGLCLACVDEGSHRFAACLMHRIPFALGQPQLLTGHMISYFGPFQSTNTNTAGSNANGNI